MEDEKRDLLDRAQGLFEEKEYARAMEAYQEIYSRFPEWEYAEHSLMMIGLCHSWLDQLDEAIAAYEKAIREYPDLIGFVDTTYFYLGWAQYRRGEREKAIKSLEKCVELGRTQQPRARRFRGPVKGRKTRPRSPREFPHMEAKRTLENFRAEALFLEGRYEDAIAEYSAISERYPEWKDSECALFMIGVCLKKMGRNSEAIEAFELAARRFPDLKGWTDVTYLHLGRVYEEEGETAKAVKAYEEAVRLGEGHRGPDAFPLKQANDRLSELQQEAEAQ